MDFLYTLLGFFKNKSQSLLELETLITSVAAIFELLLTLRPADIELKSIGSDIYLRWVNELLSRVDFKDSTHTTTFEICRDISEKMDRSIELDSTKKEIFENYSKPTNIQTFSAIVWISSKYSSGHFLQQVLRERCASILQLDLSGMCALPSSMIVDLIGQCIRLVSLKLYNCWQIETENVLDIVNIGHPNLQYIDLSFCHKITAPALAALASIPRLKSLRIAACDQLSGPAFLQFVKNCSTELEELDISNRHGTTHGITDTAVVLLTKRCRYYLRILNLDNCVNISDTSLFAIAKNCSSLEQLHIARPLDYSNKTLITDKGICAVAKAAISSSRLHTLNLSQCRGVSETSISALAKLISLRLLIIKGINKGKPIPERILSNLNPKCNLVS